MAYGLLLLAMGRRGPEPADSFGAFPVVILLIELGLGIAIIAGMWGIFTKAGKPGWAAIIPIYNAIVLLEVVGKPIWWILLLLIPCVSIVFHILIVIELAKVFGKGAGYVIGLIFLPFIFYPVLGFGDAQYTAPSTSTWS